MNALVRRLPVFIAAAVVPLAMAVAAGPASGPALSTVQLQEYLWDRVYGDKKWEWEIDDFKAASQFSIQGAEGKTPAETFAAAGGFFGLRITDLPGAPVIHDNKMTYLWSHKPSVSSDERNLSEKRGHRVKADKAFVHIIPQMVGLDQPEIRRFVKEGDIIVYWHPEQRDGKLERLREWRATHAATIIEMQLPDPDGRQVTRKLATSDTPPGYAKAFDGSDGTPFHVFRCLPRAKRAEGSLEQGEALPERIADAYRAQIARWATLGYDKFDFNGQYGSMTFRRAEQIDDYAKSFLATQEQIAAGYAKRVESMYCAWFAYVNLNLGAMRPINSSGLPDRLGRFSFEKLAADSRSLTFKSPLHRYGQGKLADYKAADDVVRRAELVFPPLTASELVTNFLDRTIGPNRQATLDVARWKGHALLKAELLAKLKPTLMEAFRVNPDTRGFDARQASDADVREYNETMDRLLTEMIAYYQQAAKQDYPDRNAVVAEERQARKKVRDIRDKARQPDGLGRRWVPPYAFAAEAECMSQFLGDEGEPVYNSQLVYVGTVVPERFLKKSGGADSQSIEPITARASNAWDKKYHSDSKIAKALGVSSDALESLWRRLTEEDDPRCGFNEHETRVLRVMRNAWIKNLPRDPAVRATPEWQKKIVLHNQFGIDDVLLRRLLVAQWNDPGSVRPVIYGQDRYTIAGGVENVRSLFSYQSEDKYQAMKSRAEHTANDAARVVGFPRLTYMPRCGGGVDKTPAADDPTCQPNR